MATKTINISLPQEVVDQIDQRAKREYRGRSELIKQATLSYIRSQDNCDLFRRDLSKRAKEMGIKTEDDVEELVDSIRK